MRWPTIARSKRDTTACSARGFLPGAKVDHYPWFKRICNRLANHAIRWMFWTEFNDLTNAFKAYRSDVLHVCGPFRASHFNITIEMSLSALSRGYKIAQIPIRWYGRTWGASNLRIGEMGRRYLSTLLMVFFERVLIADDVRADGKIKHAELDRRRDSQSKAKDQKDPAESSEVAMTAQE